MTAKLSAAKHRQLEQATDYATWRTHAVDLDAQSDMERIGRSTARAAVSHPGTGFEPHANPRLLARVVGSP